MKPLLYVGCPTSERADTENVLVSANFSVLWADSAAAAIGELQKHDMPVLLDLSRGAAALQIARDLRAQRPNVLMFAVVDNRRPDLTTEAVLTGVADVFARPPAARRLANAIDQELPHGARSHTRPPESGGEVLYSHSASMRDVVALMSRAAAMRAGVILRGEDGTGRHVVARAIHAAQSDGAAFVYVDCGSFEGDGLEVELFGATGRPRTIRGDRDAVHGCERISRQSRLYDAIGGTLYLKNIADASTRVQARLSRLLRDREAVLAETGVTIGFDMRPMAAVDPGIDTAVQEGRVRDELFRRLSVIRIDMPPLRNRKEDIPALANYFLREICRARGVPPKTLSRPALSLIAALPWRANAVELRTMLDAIVTGLAGKGIGLDDVLAHVRLDGGSVTFAERGTLRQARARFEREYIVHVLEQHHGRISEAAKVLGIQRTNLYRKLRSLRVDRRVVR
ncbi:MAG TPA: sigma 54-interacting transcriptional regulator [Vicinamibacterales bacterium]|nr:sigma 54-interacting transcriptional regulator [Vicinamibacterales bacterium]